MTQPYFQTAKSFVDVPATEDGVDTASFLLASTDFVNMFDLLGSGVFGFVQTDLRSNLAGVRSRFESHSSESATLEQLAKNEVEAGTRQATACLVRLIRGLLFACRALQNMQTDPNAELHVCFRRSYDQVLKHHHSFIVRSVVTMAIRAVPRRRDFYDRIAQGASHEELDEALTKWLAGLDSVVVHMQTFLEQGNYGKV